MLRKAHKKLSRSLHQWLPLVAVITIMSGTLYIVVQQDFRQTANDPQIQLAEDVAARLSQGEPPQAIIRPGEIDISTSISPFVAIYDATGKLVISSATLGGQPIDIPNGVFNTTKARGEDRLTWQPHAGVRQALIITHYTASGGGYVVAGRSLREVEHRIDLLGFYVILGWCAMMVATALLIVLLNDEPRGLERILS